MCKRAGELNWVNPPVVVVSLCGGVAFVACGHRVLKACRWECEGDGVHKSGGFVSAV